MKNKKLIVLASVFLMATTAFAVSGCKPTTEGPTGPAYTVEFASETMTLMLGEKTTLTTTYDQADGATLGFTSSDPSVVSVDEYGRIEALSVGTATITVTYGEASDTCVVEVTMGTLLPTLSLPNIAEEEVTTYKSAEWVLTGEVIFNEKTYDDVTLTYEVSDPTVGTVDEDGVFKPLKTGTTTVTVAGTWRGNTGAAMTKTITFIVVPEVILLVNGGASQIDLSTETVEGTDYNAVSPFEIYATVDGEEMPVSVEVTQNAQLVTYDEVAKTISSNGFKGESEITLTYEVEGVTQYLKVPVTIDLTIYKHETLVENFSAIHGDVATGDSLRSILGADILFAYDEAGNALTVKDNKVYGIETSKTGSFRSTITICSARRGYTVELDGYSGIFARAEDFEVFNVNASYASGKFSEVDTTKPLGAFDGYYVLMNNIDATGYTHNNGGVNLSGRGQANNFPVGLHGTFDGRGYTIKGMTIGAYGLFGYISNGATVKDVAFVDVNLKNEQRAATLAQWIYNATISNVYVHLAEGTYTEGKMSGFAGGIHTSVVKSCIVDAKDCVFEHRSSSVFACALHEFAAKGDGRTVYTDVYVITDAEVLGWYDYNNEYRLFYAENKMPAETPAPQAEGDTTEKQNANYKITGVFQYSSLAELTAAGKTFAAFNDCWDATSGAPVWKSVNGEYPEVEQPSMGSKFNGESVGDFNPDWIR